MSKIRVGAASLASLIAMVQAVPAFAQDAPAAAAETPKPIASDEIIVTAQRRSETLERTPVAVSVLSGAMLQRQAIVTESDLQVATPGLTIRAGYNSNQLNYALRGQSLDAFSDTRPGVLPYFNEVQLDGVGGGSSAFYDLQSIQVLKGPQGTLFGRNSTGGAVLFTSTRPTREFGGYVSGRLGNYKLRQFEGALNVPLVGDTVLARVAGFYEKRDGYQRNLFNNTRAGNVDRYGLRGSLTIKLTDTIKNELVVDYLHSDGNSLSGLIDSLEPTGLIPLIALTNFGNQPQFNFLINAFTGGAAIADVQVVFKGDYEEFTAKTTAQGTFSISIPEGDYEVYAGGWGVLSKYVGKRTISSNGTTVNLGLQRGYSDDYWGDFGWKVTGNATAGAWSRGLSAQANNGADITQPRGDSPSDNDNLCYFTANGSCNGGPGSGDVDGGATILTSQPMKIRTFSDPQLTFNYWFYNGGGNSTPNDTFTVILNNGLRDTTILATRQSGTAWRQSPVFKVKNYLPLTDSMTITFRIADSDPGHLVEGAVDNFRLIDLNAVPTLTDTWQLKAYPNPFSQYINLNFKLEDGTKNAVIKVVNALGQVVARQNEPRTEGVVFLGSTWPTGVYFIKIEAEGKESPVVKVVKQ